MNFAPGAWRYAIVPLLAAPFALVFSVTASAIAALIGVGTLAFFRDPDRSPPSTGVVSPADGKVSVLREEGDRVRLGVFMNVWNVHVVRAPFDGTIVDVEHVPGANKPAFSKESDRNERVHLRFAPEEDDDAIRDGDEAADDGDDAIDDGDEAGGDGDATADDGEFDPGTSDREVTLIAGAFARRIFPYVEPGETVERGERVGHIAFGSRVDVLFSPAIDREDLAVDVGDRVTSGETVVVESLDGLDGFPLDGDGEFDAIGESTVGESTIGESTIERSTDDGPDEPAGGGETWT